MVKRTLASQKTVQRFATAAISVGAIILASGCAATTDNPSPTHYWEAEEAVTKVDYNRDNSQCRGEAGVISAADMAEETPSFESYRRCMMERGYSLQTF